MVSWLSSRAWRDRVGVGVPWGWGVVWVPTNTTITMTKHTSRQRFVYEGSVEENRFLGVPSAVGVAGVRSDQLNGAAVWAVTEHARVRQANEGLTRSTVWYRLGLSSVSITLSSLIPSQISHSVSVSKSEDHTHTHTPKKNLRTPVLGPTPSHMMAPSLRYFPSATYGAARR